jgi:hypothetical protein
MSIALGQFRLSLMWTEAFEHLLSGEADVADDRAFLGRSVQYVARFEQEQKHIRQTPYRRNNPAGDVHLPWPGPWGQRFWMHYLGGVPPGQVTGAAAWNALVPFREKTAGSVKARWLPGSVSHETYLYPHGLGFLLSVTFRPRSPAALVPAVRTAFNARRDRTFALSLDGAQKSLVSEALAGEVMDRARASLLPDQTLPTTRRWEPFTVLTVLSATGADPSKPPPPEVVAALDAVTSWRRGWDPANAPELKDGNRLPAGAPGDLVYAGRQGRAVWFPRLFDPGREQHALGCFHRNLSLLSLTVASLSEMVRLADRLIQAGDDIPVRMLECLANAIRLLDDLKEGRRTSTYRSHSPRHQIEHEEVLEPLSRVREFLS